MAKSNSNNIFLKIKSKKNKLDNKIYYNKKTFDLVDTLVEKEKKLYKKRFTKIYKKLFWSIKQELTNSIINKN